MGFFFLLVGSGSKDFGYSGIIAHIDIQEVNFRFRFDGRQLKSGLGNILLSGNSSSPRLENHHQLQKMLHFYPPSYALWSLKVLNTIISNTLIQLFHYKNYIVNKLNKS
jgi:hypothetical protein